MACFIYIDGVEVDVDRRSIFIEKRIEERSMAKFVVVDKNATATYEPGMIVEILKPWAFPPFFEYLFVGFIDTPGRKRLAPGSGLLHDISCMDNHYLADKRLVVRAYANQTAGYIARDILTDYLAAEGITEGDIQDGPVIKSAIFNFVRASEAFDALKELSGFTWFIDEVKDLYFIDRATYAAPWDLDSVTYQAIKDSVHLSTGNPLYRNRQYVRGGKGITDLQTEHFTGDGIVKSFALGYPLALEPTITLTPGGIQLVGIKGLETGMDYYWSKGDNTVYAEIFPGPGVDVEVQYYGQYPLIVLVVDEAARLARQAIEGGTGIVEDIVIEVQHESKDAVTESAKAKLTQYCQSAEKFIYQTDESGLYPGQLQAITYGPFGFAAHDMLIESVSITADGELILFDVSCVTGPVMGSWTRFFSALITRQDKQIAIGDSLLLVPLQQYETLALLEVTNLHSDDFSGGLVNRWIALPPTQSEGHNIEHELLTLVEAPAITSHDTEDYHWDDVDALWDFATWT